MQCKKEDTEMRNINKISILLLITIMILGMFSSCTKKSEQQEEIQEVSFEKTDRFELLEYETDENTISMISHDGELIIHIHDHTPVLFEDGIFARESLEEGQTLAELLVGRMLVVTYGITTRSIPPQASPDKVVIIYEKIEPLPDTVFTEQ